jgi:hypothetical protein
MGRTPLIGVVVSNILHKLCKKHGTNRIGPGDATG